MAICHNSNGNRVFHSIGCVRQCDVLVDVINRDAGDLIRGTGGLDSAAVLQQVVVAHGLQELLTELIVETCPHGRDVIVEGLQLIERNVGVV